MAVGILLVTHNKIGAALLKAAEQLLPSPLTTKVDCISIPYDCTPEDEVAKLKQHCKRVDDGAGVLLLADLYSATPCNIAKQLSHDGQRWLVSGLNLPMLLKTLNYCHLDGKELAKKAYQGGRESVIQLW